MTHESEIAETKTPNPRMKLSLVMIVAGIALVVVLVVRIRNGTVEWVDVKRGVSMGDLVEVFGDLSDNDVVATRGTDELRAGTKVNMKESAPSR